MVHSQMVTMTRLGQDKDKSAFLVSLTGAGAKQLGHEFVSAFSDILSSRRIGARAAGTPNSHP